MRPNGQRSTESAEARVERYFKLSWAEAVSAVLAGYVAALINCERYEGLGSPDALADSLARIRALV